MRIDNVVLALLAILAGILLLGGWLSANIVVGIWLLVYGVVTLLRRA